MHTYQVSTPSNNVATGSKLTKSMIQRGVTIEHSIHLTYMLMIGEFYSCNTISVTFETTLFQVRVILQLDGLPIGQQPYLLFNVGTKTIHYNLVTVCF